MEASIASTEVGREVVMAHVWERTVHQFIAGEYDVAQMSYGLYETLEKMTDEEYALACVCEDEGCHCHL